jgi:tetratricopeptide (TPR) repeat protein
LQGFCIFPKNGDIMKSISNSHKRTREYYLRIAIDNYNMGRYQDTIAACEQAIRIDPRYARAYYGKGLAFACLKKYPAAIVAYHKAIEYDPHNYNIYIHRADAYKELGHYKKALSDYCQAFKDNDGEMHDRRIKVRHAISKELDQHGYAYIYIGDLNDEQLLYLCERVRQGDDADDALRHVKSESFLGTRYYDPTKPEEVEEYDWENKPLNSRDTMQRYTQYHYNGNYKE